MTAKEFSTLRRYAMKMVRDEDDRDNLVLLAYAESVRLGEKSQVPLLVNSMKLRAKESSHAFGGVRLVGKSKRDAWSHGVVSISKPMDDNGTVVAEFLGTYGDDPLGLLAVDAFEQALTPDEMTVATEIASGYREKESLSRLGLERKDFRRIKAKVRRKAIDYLVPPRFPSKASASTLASGQAPIL